jgi:hypothetical protein
MRNSKSSIAISTGLMGGGLSVMAGYGSTLEDKPKGCFLIGDLDKGLIGMDKPKGCLIECVDNEKRTDREGGETEGAGKGSG